MQNSEVWLILAMVLGNHETDVPPLAACGAPAASSAAMQATHLQRSPGV